ncbi:MAG TPA: CsbD family protein [Pyrinomonadaceae bacterium]|nr:CsbD family protein [Pyrinomonadaceae bacterium]
MADDRRDRGEGTLGEEASAFGQRVKGAAKDAAGSITGDRSLEREGERENAAGNARQEANDVLGDRDTLTTGTATAATGTASARTSTGRSVTGLFRNRESAERAYRSLSDRGYSKDDVNLLMSDKTRDEWFKDDRRDTDLGDKALEGAGVGSAIGGTVGAVLAAIAAIGTSVVLPGLGLVVAGPIAAALAGAGAGGLTGGLVGALVGSGIPEERAKHYDEGVRSGGMVMGVNARSDEDAEYFERDWRSHGEHIYR